MLTWGPQKPEHLRRKVFCKSPGQNHMSVDAEIIRGDTLDKDLTSRDRKPRNLYPNENEMNANVVRYTNLGRSGFSSRRAAREKTTEESASHHALTSSLGKKEFEKRWPGDPKNPNTFEEKVFCKSPGQNYMSVDAEIIQADTLDKDLTSIDRKPRNLYPNENEMNANVAR